MTPAIEVVDYDPAWPDRFAAERDRLLSPAPLRAVLHDIEHVGSTAVPGQAAKPVIDIMASVDDLAALDEALAALEGLGYRRRETGMRARLFLRREPDGGAPAVHLHLVGRDTWPERKERLMRDHLRDHPEDVRAHGELKRRLAAAFPDDPEAYTRGKTAFVQGVMDRVRAARGLPPEDVWED